MPYPRRKSSKQVLVKKRRAIPHRHLNAFSRLYGRYSVTTYANRNFVYGTRFQLATGAATTFGSEHIMRLNSGFDPDFSVAGHQPYGWDQQGAIYGTYKVYACTVDCTFFSPSAANVVCGAQVSATADITTLGGASIMTATERFNTWVRDIPNTGSQIVHFRETFDIADVTGESKTQWEGNDTFAAIFNANPISVCFLRLAAADYSGGAGGSTVEVRMSLTYHTRTYNRLTQAIS